MISKFKKIIAVACVAAAAVFPVACGIDTEQISSNDTDNNIPHEHDFVLYTVEPTCETPGFSYYKCFCGEQQALDSAVPPTGHSFTKFVFNDDATCTHYGTETAECTVCHYKITQTADNYPLKDHAFVHYVPNGDATCTANGTETAKCENCDETDTREIPNTMIEHDYQGDYCTVCKAIAPNANVTRGLEYYAVHEGSIFSAIIAYKVSGIGSADVEVVTVPMYHDGLPVVGVMTGAFKNAMRITKVVLPETVTEIDESAFDNCQYLREVVLPNGLKTIGRQAFYNCGIRTAVIPDSIESIGQTPFYGCTELEELTVPFLGYTADDTVDATMRHLVFVSGQKIIPDSLIKITLTRTTELIDTAFSGCDRLECVALPDTLTKIGKAFVQCISLDRIEFGGTQEQWNAIDKADEWDKYLVSDYQVIFAE